MRVPYSKALGVLLRSILVEREPIYRQQEETMGAFAAECFGLSNEKVRSVHVATSINCDLSLRSGSGHIRRNRW